MLQRTILSWDADVNFVQALQALLARQFRGSPAEVAADVRPDPRPDLLPGDGALSGTLSVSEKPALSQKHHPTSQEISGWAMGGSSLSD